VKITQLSLDGIKLLQQFEGLRLEAYPDSAGIWTIGYGTTRYPDGTKVRPSDVCSQEEADRYFRHDLRRFELAVDALTVDALNQPQFDALTSFVYNTGESAYRDSTLRKRVNANPADPAIRAQFMRWHNAGGNPVLGLWRRRHREADFYIGVSTPMPPGPMERIA
jgi:lysozyme